jgi:hypothetical protein
MKSAILLLILTLFVLFATGGATALSSTLVWDPNTDEVMGYRIYYGTSQTSMTKMVDIGNTTVYDLDKLPLAESIQYFLSLTAYNNFGESGKTSPVVYTPADTTPPNPPVGLEIVSVNLEK